MSAPLTLSSCDNPQTAIIWLHGLGCCGENYRDFIHHFQVPGGIKLILPSALPRPVTLHQGTLMPAWFDVLEIDVDAPVDTTGLYAATERVHALIDLERKRGFTPDRIVLGGFSQGGSLAISSALCYRQPLLGAIGVSSFLSGNLPKCPTDTPILMCFGRQDPVVDISLGETTAQRLRDAGHTVDWHAFDTEHSFCVEEIQVINDWLGQLVAPKLL